MSSDSITISELKRSLQKNLLLLFPGNEALSISKLILEHFGFTSLEIVKDPAAIVQNKIHSEIKKIVNELGRNRPIQYILGEAYFYDLIFKVTEDTLIPRPETEELVSNILLDVSMDEARIMDIGTGSGCIAVTLARHLLKAEIHAMDLHESILQIARENAKRNHARVIFHQDDILNYTSQKKYGKFDVIVSNPPYVTQEDRKWMEPRVLEYEPEIALFVPQDDPLIFFKQILRFASSHLAADGHIWVEINEKKGKETSSLFLDSGYQDVRIVKDIHGKDRFIKANNKSKY